MIDENELIDNRSDPDYRAVLEDLYLEQGFKITRLGTALILATAADVDFDAADDVAAIDVDVGAVVNVDSVDSVAVDSFDSVVVDGDGVGTVGVVSADADVGISDALYGEIDMQDGLKIIQLPGSYGYYPVTYCGYISRIKGDEYILHAGARAIIRKGQIRSLGSLASDGPKDDHILGDSEKGIEEFNRLLVRRCRPASHAVWGSLCQKGR